MNEIQDKIKKLISQTIPVSHLVVEGDGSHFQAIIVSNIFDGRSRLDRHKLVYAALGDSFDREVHALSFKVYTENEWKNLK